MPKGKQPTTEDRSPRLIKRGDVVRVKGQKNYEPVRFISVVLHMANGQDIVYSTDEKVVLALNPEEDFEEVWAKAEELGLIDE